MKNIVVCFDHERAGARTGAHVRTLIDLVDDDRTDQLIWYGCNLADAYLFLVDHYAAGDRIYLFGAGCGAYCARVLTRLLNTAGVLPADSDLLDYALAHWVLPHTHRTADDWARLGRLAAELTGATPVPVWFLGLWDTAKIPGAQRLSSQRRDLDAMDNVIDGRHAVALDEYRIPAAEYLLSEVAAERIEEVWFRGTHADVTGAGAQAGLGRITLEWVLDGALRAGLRLRDGAYESLPSPTELDVLDRGRRSPAMTFLAGVRLSRIPSDGALVHASVEMYLRHRPDYWRRLPPSVVWSDAGWPARSERLIAALDSLKPDIAPIELAS